ncbi:MAG TPA: rhodanese-like domain-containing protein [Candidatus Binataceae bacterium]|nr:rhodanese-like domain-containing protein [Candidatus Binataceae bacterium]
MSVKNLIRDLAGVIGLATLSLVAGVTINHFRASPLPLAYRTPEQRLSAELTTLVQAPPFQLSQIDTLSLDQFRRDVDDKNTLILDARAAPFYAQGHVPGALNLSRDDFAADYRRLKAALDASRDKQIVVYCSGGDCHDSRMVASALLSLGFSKVQVFTDGWTGWTQAGLPVAQ